MHRKKKGARHGQKRKRRKERKEAKERKEDKEKTIRGIITKPNIITACADARALVGIVSVASGCSSMTPSDKTQTMGVYAFGIPGIAVITQSQQTADNAGSDTNASAQSNPVSVDTKVK